MSCENCVYFRRLGDERNLFACMYCHDTGKMRRCDPEFCTRKLILPYEIKTEYMKALRFRTAETITLEEIMNLIKSRDGAGEIIRDDLSVKTDTYIMDDIRGREICINA